MSATQTPPTFLPFNRERIPPELATRRQWVGCNVVPTGKPERPYDKVPMNPRTGQNASTSDSATWGTLDEALRARDRYGWQGVGYVFSADDPYIGIDKDASVDRNTGEIAPDGIALVRRFNSYTEYSGSGSGLHTIVRSQYPLPKGNKKSLLKLEVYDRDRFFWMTGHVLPGYETIRDVDDEVIVWHRGIWGERQNQPSQAAPSSSRLTDGEIIRLATEAKNGGKFRSLYDRGDTSDYGGDESSADLALLCIFAFYTRDEGQLERIFGGSALGRRDKWIKRADYRERTIKAALEVVTETYTPHTAPRVNGTYSSNGHHATGHHGTASEDPATPKAKLLLADFASYLPDRKYIYMPTGKVWDPAGIDRAFPPIKVGEGEEAVKIKQSTLIDAENPVHDLTWAPGRPRIIENAFLDQGGWLSKEGARVYNGYRPPRPFEGIPEKAARWLDHVELVYPDNAERIVEWLAHRVQFPDIKVNHALVLGGSQGIGKDTILEPVRQAVGAWNFGDVSPVELMGRFNAFLKNVILRVSELRDLGDRDRYGFYEHTKTLIAAPPDTILIDEKNIRAYRVPNLIGLIFTTNHRTDGLYLPADDRRHYVAWSDLTPNDFPDGYWEDLYCWFEDDGEGGTGTAHVTACLASWDLSSFNPKAPPPKTTAFWDIVAAGRAPEDADVADSVAKLSDPEALTIDDLAEASSDLDFKAWLRDRKNSRQIPHRLEAAGYVATRNPTTKDGLWVVKGRRQVIYAQKDLSIRERIEAAAKRAGRTW